MAERCQRCRAERVASVVVSPSTAVTIYRGDVSVTEVPGDMGITDTEGVRVAFDWCLNCGQIQGEWPRPRTAVDDDAAMRPGAFKRFEEWATRVSDSRVGARTGNASSRRRRCALTARCGDGGEYNGC
jgi:hypothetical protein